MMIGKSASNMMAIRNPCVSGDILTLAADRIHLGWADWLTVDEAMILFPLMRIECG